MYSVFQQTVEETIKQVQEKWNNKQEQLVFIEIANDQYSQVVQDLKTKNLKDIEWILKYLVKSAFSYDQIRIIMESGFLLNYEGENDDDNEIDSYSYNFESPFLLSSYLLMYYFQTRGYDNKSARKATLKATGNNQVIQTYITKLIKSSNQRKISKEIYIESKSQNYQLEQADLQNKIFQQVSGKLSNKEFLLSLIKNESKVDKALSLILPVLESKVNLEQAESIAKSIESYIIQLSFNLLFPDEIEMLINQIIQLPFERFLRENVVQEVKYILKNRQPIHINPNDEFLQYEIVTFKYTSVFCEKVEDTTNYVLDKYKNKSIIMFEVCPEQYKDVVLTVSQKLDISKKQIQKKIAISQITQEQMSIMVQAGYILNFLKEEKDKVIFSDSQFLSFLLVVYTHHKMNGSWEESVKLGVKHMITRLNRKQLIKISDESARRKQMNTFLHPVLKEMIRKVPKNIQNKVIEPIFSNNIFTSASKLMRDNIVTSFGISFLTAISDIKKLVSGSLTKRDFLMSSIKNMSSTSVDIIARAMGSTLGPAGSIAGQFFASSAVEFARGKLESVLPYTIAERVSILFEQNLEELSQEILTNDEIKGILNDIKSFGMANFLKDLSENANENTDLKKSCKDFIKTQIIECLKKRKPIMIGKDPIK